MSATAHRDFRIIINDDFDSHRDFGQDLFDMWGRTAVNTFSLNIGADVVHYDSQVRATVKENLRLAHEEGRLPDDRGQQWYAFFVEGGRDPLAMAVEGCRRNSIEIFASLRINDIHHGADPEDDGLRLGISPFWREHPEFRAKGWERAREEAFEGKYPDYRKERWDRRAWASYSFEHPEVRQRVLDVVREVSERYDIDGFDLDFTRQPPFFDRGREYACRHHMTEMVREAHEILAEAGKKKGKRIRLMASCGSTVEKSEAVGLDAGTWVKEGLVDILLPRQDCGAGTDIPVEAFVELAKGTEVEICPNFDNVARPGQTANIYVTAAVLRAAAMRSYRGGGDGMQLFNFFCVNERGNFESLLYGEGMFSEIGEREVIEGKDKYCVFMQGLPVALTGGEPAEQPHGRVTYWIDVSFGRRVPPPAPGRKASGKAEYRFRIDDDVRAARAAGRLRQGQLTFDIVHAGPEDEIRFELNGEAVGEEALWGVYCGGDPPSGCEHLPPFMHYALDLAKVEDVRVGVNTLGIEAVKLGEPTGTSERFRGLDAALYNVELLVRYA